jgi:nucleoside-diphosphate-sugar epimerase
MPRRTVLITGASGLVGYAAMKHFASEPGCDVIAVSRRKPDETFGARFVPADLTNTQHCAELFGAMTGVTHVVYAALHERPGLIAGWQEAEQIKINDLMLRNLLGPLEKVAKGLRHVCLLQGTKAYGVHVRPMKVPAREGRSEARDIPNFYWAQEDYLRGLQSEKSWGFTILRPVLIVGYSWGSAMNVIPALGVYAAFMRERGLPLHYPGGPARVGQVVDAGLLARCIAWAGEAQSAFNGTFNVANGDIYTWLNVWPAIARACRMFPGEPVPMSLEKEILPCEEEWARIRAKHGLVSPGLKAFIGQSFEYADYQMGYGRTQPAPPSFSSTNKLHDAGFHEVMDSEEMFAKWFGEFSRRRLLP